MPKIYHESLENKKSLTLIVPKPPLWDKWEFG